MKPLDPPAPRRRRSPAPLLAVCLAALALAAALPTAAAADAGVRSRFVLLSGRPTADTAGGSASGVVVVPGTVLRLGGAGVGRGPDEDAEARSRELAALSDKLRRTLRLDRVDILYTQELSLDLERPEELPPPTATSPVRIEVELQGYNEQVVTYAVTLREGSSTIANSVVAVERDGRAVVGGLDGDDAPYLFLVIEPIRRLSTVRRVTEGITPPRVLERLVPEYTAKAKEARVQGVVILQAEIDERGDVRGVTVLKGLPYGLDEVAADAVRSWKFQPALDEQGQPVSVLYNLTISFTLADDEGGPPPALRNLPPSGT